MGGFRDDDPEVENLLSQLQEDSLLKLNVNSHGFNLPDQNAIDQSPLQGNLLTRFQNLKSPKNPNSSTELDIEQRLLALKNSSPKQPNKAASSSVSSSSIKSPKMKETEEATVKSESKLRKIVKQLSMGKKKTDNVSEVDMLLAAAKDEVELDRQHRNSNEGHEEEEEEDTGLDIDVEDLSVKKLKKELSKASIEEGRLTREAQKVIEWASHVARLEGSVSDESDLEELLRMEEEKMKSQNKKKKGKKWSLF